MSAAGPELPPHLLAKRKRQQEEAQKNDSSTSSGANQESPKRQKVSGPELPPSASPTPAGPSLPPTVATPPVGPTLPPSEPRSARPVAGPAPPPAPLDERPLAPPDSDDDSDDDGFGPSLPTAADLNPSTSNSGPSVSQPAAPARAQRDEWMTLPPQQDDLAARMDPSKMRARGFNTGKNARGGNTTPAGGNIAAAWTETPDEKLKRLQDEAMGVKPATAGHIDAREAAKNKEKEAEARRIREQTDKARGPSLMAQHKESNPENKDDDPSKRAFNREKDIGGSSLGLVDKKDLLNKASNFGSKFSGGGYL
ncbi:hypothetical protein E4T50_10397 [Aureobasidium sp. EXF-12298]|nr:hypothetical protein E4T50_10397 [Aureobasidium sp. EXF-12298]